MFPTSSDKCFLILVFLFCAPAYLLLAQETTEEYDDHIASFADKILIKANLDTRTNIYSYYNSSEEERLILAPNNKFKFSLSLDYEFLGFSIGFAPKFLPENNDDDLKGESSFTDYNFRFFFGNWSQTVYYSNATGYYVENTNDFIDDWIAGRDPYIQFPNLKTITWGGTTSYIFNNKFSLRNVAYQTEWQKKSAGSFIPKVLYDYNRISNTFQGAKSVEDAFDLSLAAGYYYTLVIYKNWYVSPYISPALGVRFSWETSRENGLTTRENNTYLLKSLESGLQLGYSSKKIVFGLQTDVLVNWYNEDKTSNIIQDKVYAKVYFGYRFDPPKQVTALFKNLTKGL